MSLSMALGSTRTWVGWNTDLICGSETAVLCDTTKKSSRMGDAGAAKALRRVAASLRPVQFATCAEMRNARHSFRKSAVYWDQRALPLTAVLRACPPAS